MIGGKCTLCFVLFSFLWMIIPVRGDADVSCVFMERCILPCSFQSGLSTIIHWFQVTPRDLNVHSFYSNSDRLGYQDQQFTGRTLLFHDQISKGNASLQLTGVKVQDEGRYKCHTSTIQGNQDSFINLKVDAPVHKINIQHVGNRLTCSSEGIYPEPKLTWFISPPSNMSLQINDTVQQTEQNLYNISSFLIFSNNDRDLVYSCTVSTRRNKRRATWKQLTSVTHGYSETTISCSKLNTSLKSLIWRFNHSQTILTQTRSGGNYIVSEEWKKHVKNVSKSGSLTLQDLSSDQEGMYTCEISDAEETYINTFLKIDNIKDNTGTWVLTSIAVIVAAIVAVICWCTIKRKRSSEENQELTQMKTINSDAGREDPGEDTTAAMLHQNGEILPKKVHI